MLVFATALVAALVAPRPVAAASQCWERLLTDWSDGAILGSYTVGCYGAALRSLPEDVRLYSSASDDIRRALAASILATRKPTSVSSRGGEPPEGGTQAVATARDAGFPWLPLLLAGSLAGVVGAIGAAGLVARQRLRARRLSPADLVR